MKEQYRPITMPVCRCGRVAVCKHVRRVIYHHFPALRLFMRIPQRDLWAVGCTKCVGSGRTGNTKRAAVEAFERAQAVEVNMER